MDDWDFVDLREDMTCEEMDFEELPLPKGSSSTWLDFPPPRVTDRMHPCPLVLLQPNHSRNARHQAESKPSFDISASTNPPTSTNFWIHDSRPPSPQGTPFLKQESESVPQLPSRTYELGSTQYEDDGRLPSWFYTHAAEIKVIQVGVMFLQAPYNAAKDMALSLFGRDAIVIDRDIPRWSVNGYDPEHNSVVIPQMRETPSGSEFLFFSPTSARRAASEDDAPTVNGLRVPRRIKRTMRRLNEDNDRMIRAKNHPLARCYSRELSTPLEDIVVQSWRFVQRRARLRNLLESRHLEVLKTWLLVRKRHLVEEDLAHGWPCRETPGDVDVTLDSSGAELADAFEMAMESSDPEVIQRVCEGFAAIRLQQGMGFGFPDTPGGRNMSDSECERNTRHRYATRRKIPKI